MELKKLTKIQIAIDDLFKPTTNGLSMWITKDMIINFNNGILDWGNNGITRQGLFHKDNRYIWEFKRKNDKPSGKIEAIRTIGLNEDILAGKDRPIRSDIHRYHKSKGCIICGSLTDLVTDHKNDLYNDPRVLDIKTQTINDFQCLCNHCNLQKRQVAKKTLETGKRYGATNIPILSIFGIDFIQGDENFDKSDVNAMVGTFWYDPVEFMKHINNTIKYL
jgi:5-methylcytosine-specific restriction endonuclease McrA